MKAILYNTNIVFRSTSIVKETFEFDPLAGAGSLEITSAVKGKKGMFSFYGAGLADWKIGTKVGSDSVITTNWSISNLYSPWMYLDFTSVDRIFMVCPTASIDSNKIVITIVEDLAYADIPDSFYKDSVSINPNTTTGVCTPGTSAANNKMTMAFTRNARITFSDTIKIRVYKYAANGDFISSDILTNVSSFDTTSYLATAGKVIITIPNTASITDIEFDEE